MKLNRPYGVITKEKIEDILNQPDLLYPMNIQNEHYVLSILKLFIVSLFRKKKGNTKNLYPCQVDQQKHYSCIITTLLHMFTRIFIWHSRIFCHDSNLRNSSVRLSVCLFVIKLSKYLHISSLAPSRSLQFSLALSSLALSL